MLLKRKCAVSNKDDKRFKVRNLEVAKYDKVLLSHTITMKCQTLKKYRTMRCHMVAIHQKALPAYSKSLNVVLCHVTWSP